MNPSYLSKMGPDELDAYGRMVGVDVTRASDPDEKARRIEEARDRAVTVRALGIDLRVTMRRATDERFSRLINKAGRTDAETDEAFRLLLGEEQVAEVYSAATDEDGTVDAYAVGLAYATVLNSHELKNF